MSGMDLPMPPNIETIVKSVAVMSSREMTQTAFWIGPRLLVSTLHMHSWVQGKPSDVECEFVREQGELYNVETETSSQLLSEESPKVQLIKYSTAHDLGIFRLHEQHPPRKEWIEIEWLMEGDEAHKQNLVAGQTVACIVFNGEMSPNDESAVKAAAFDYLKHNFPAIASQVSGFRSFC